jgi:hypothetical protein
MVLLSFPGVVLAKTYVDDQYLKWDVLERQCAEEISGDDESYLYLRLSGSPVRINKDLKSGPEKLRPGEVDISGNSEESKVKEVDKNLLQLKDKTLYYHDIPVMDMGKYLEENDCFYRENPYYTRTDISFYAYEYNLEGGGKVFQVITFIDCYIPAPYTPSYSDTFFISGPDVHRLVVDQDFRLTGTWENSDGSFWLEGWLKKGKASKENSLYLIGSGLKVFSFNEVLQKNDIQVLGQVENSLIVRAETRTLNPYFPLDQKKYEVAGSGVYAVCSDGSYTRRKESIEDYKSIYLDREGNIYAISSDGKKIKNLTTGIEYHLEEAVTPFDREVQTLRGLDFNYGTSQTRLGQDGSKWYVQDCRIIREEKGKKSVFSKGLPVLMYPVENLFIDYEGGKWLLGPAGIAYYREDLMEEALNMNPFLDGGIYPGGYKNIYVDGYKRIWFFDHDIKCVPFKESAMIVLESGLIQGFEQVIHEYSENKDLGVFVYQKENPDGSYTIRALTINREGKINHQDYTLDKKLLRYFVYDGKLHMVLPDGLMILKDNKKLTVRNASLLEGLDFRYRDNDRLVFAGEYRLVMVSIPKPGEAVDTFVKTPTAVTVNGKILPTYRVQGHLAICVEDLRHCGYDMIWDPVQRTTSLMYQKDKLPDMKAPSELQASQGMIYYSDIDVYINGVWHRTYNTGGYSLVALESLSLCNLCNS